MTEAGPNFLSVQTGNSAAEAKSVERTDVKSTFCNVHKEWSSISEAYNDHPAIPNGEPYFIGWMEGREFVDFMLVQRYYAWFKDFYPKSFQIRPDLQQIFEKEDLPILWCRVKPGQECFIFCEILTDKEFVQKYCIAPAPPAPPAPRVDLNLIAHQKQESDTGLVKIFATKGGNVLIPLKQCETVAQAHEFWKSNRQSVHFVCWTDRKEGKSITYDFHPAELGIWRQTITQRYYLFQERPDLKDFDDKTIVWSAIISMNPYKIEALTDEEFVKKYCTAPALPAPRTEAKKELKIARAARGEVQTRSDDPDGVYAGNIFWRTIGEAYEAYQEDPSIWKISWSEGDVRTSDWVHYRFVIEPFRNLKTWESYPDVVKLKPEIVKSRLDTTYFVNQNILTSKPVEVLSDLEFRNKYCTEPAPPAPPAPTVSLPPQSSAQPSDQPQVATSHKSKRRRRAGKKHQRRKANRLLKLQLQ